MQELGYGHSKVNHSIGEYVDGDVHTNKIENFWSNLKYRIKGTYKSVSVKHLQKYVDEAAYAFNEGNLKFKTISRMTSPIEKMFGIVTSYRIMTGTSNKRRKYVLNAYKLAA